MSNIDKQTLEEYSDKLNFNRDTLEKVYRLVDILYFMNKDSVLKDSVALKGGTAVNLLYFNLPRLSVDIDLDFTKECNSPDEMLENRKIISERIERFMKANKYERSPVRSKNYHSLDSGVYLYTNSGGMRDNIKIETNYSMRSHLFIPEYKTITTLPGKQLQFVRTLSKYDLFSAKINALLSRSAIRDLYDINNFFNSNMLENLDKDMLRKASVFYTSISQKETPLDFDLNHIDSFNLRQVKTQLLPVVKCGEHIPLESIKNNVKSKLSDLLSLKENEKDYLKAFSEKRYKPELLFDDNTVLSNIKKHPMALWKIKEHNKNQEIKDNQSASISD